MLLTMFNIEWCMIVDNMQPGEDKVSYERHLKHLQGEFSKAKRDP